LNWNDKNPDIWHELGMFYYNYQRYAQAFKVVEQAINIDNRKARYHYKMGTILEKEFDFVLSVPSLLKPILRRSNWIVIILMLTII
jgi:tetratricopeptide (TPR) repeat protein